MKKHILWLLLPLIVAFKSITPKAITIGAGVLVYDKVRSQVYLTLDDTIRFKRADYIPYLFDVGTGYSLTVDGSYNVALPPVDYNRDVQNKPNFMAVCFSADYRQLINTPSIPVAFSQMINDIGALTSSSLSITGQNLSLKSGSNTLNSVFIPTVTSGQINTALGGSPLINETDPGVGSHIKAISIGDISIWNAKFNSPSGTTSQYIRGDGSLSTFPTTKRIETYTLTTNSSGDVTTTFGISFTKPPLIVPILPNQTDKNETPINSVVSTTGFTVNVFTRATVTSLPIIGVLAGALLGATTTPVNSRIVYVLVIEQ